jgi:DNA-directed RNA polymerase subunit RPC12/RpoP
MPNERLKRCTNPVCSANIGIRRGFPAESTRCPICGSRLVFINRPRTSGKGSGKSGGKTVGRKLIGRSSGPTLGRKPRRKKQPKKWTLKDVSRKRIGRKR